MSDHKHPQYSTDRDLLNTIMKDGTATDLNLVEVARLRIRYIGFPGARDIQSDLDDIIKTWGLTEEGLFTKTRALHQQDNVYQQKFSKRDDWA